MDEISVPDPSTANLGVFQRLKLHPKGFWFVFWGELAERASFYGMRTILALYLVTVLLYKTHEGASIMQFFIASCYIAPLLGGYIADRFLGRYKTILYFSVPYIAGHLILGGIQSRPAMYIALAFLAFGSGSIKPNTSTLMGQIYEQQKKEFLLTEAFSYFYAAINIGAVVSSFFLPIVRNHWGYGVALAIPAALMAFSFAFFAIGKKHYPKDNPKALPKKTPAQRAAEWDTLKRIAGIFLMVAVFWLVYDQQASTWIYFAKDHCNLNLWGSVSVTPDQIQAFNPFLIVLLTPFFNWMWETWKAKRGGVDLPDTRKMLIGFVIVIACMATIAVAGFASQAGKVSVWWIMAATFVITLSELCVSVVGLEFAYKQAAPGTKSVVTAAFLLTVTLGDTVGGFMDNLYETKLSAGSYFLLQTAIMVAAGFIFYLIARRFERNDAKKEVGASPLLA